jgi:ESX secretion system protein EccE
MASSQGSSTATATRPPAGPAPAPFTAERRTGRVGALRVGHLVVVELVAVALLGGVAADRGRAGLWFVVATAASVVLVFAAFARTRGRWWYERRSLRGRWRRRRRDIARGVAARGSGDPVRAALAALAPGLVVRQVVDRGNRIGVGQDEDGWFAVLAVGPHSGLWGDAGGGIRLDRLAGILADPAVPVSSISVVSQSVPAPNAALDRQSRAALSYRQLLQSDPVLADQAVWVTVRLSPADAAAAAAARGGGLAGVDRAIAAALGRVGKTLGAGDLPLRILDPTALSDALTSSSGLGGRAPAGTEDWTAWYGDGVGNVGFWLSRWPRGPVEELFAALTRCPAALVSVAVTLHPPAADGQLRVACLVRVAADPNALPQAASEVVSTARQAGARLRRLDGEHGPVVYATLPTAAGVR